MNNPRLPTTIYTGNVLTRRPSGEESIHNIYTCPWHLDHSELLTPAISLHSDDHTCSKPENDLMESWTSKHVFHYTYYGSSAHQHAIYKLLSKIFSVSIRKHYYIYIIIWKALKCKTLGAYCKKSQCVCTEIGHTLGCVLSVLTPTRANSISRHSFRWQSLGNLWCLPVHRVEKADSR